MWQDDHSWGGFEWVDASDVKNNVFVFKRKGVANQEDIYVALNMVPVPLENYNIGEQASTVCQAVGRYFRAGRVI